MPTTRRSRWLALLPGAALALLAPLAAAGPAAAADPPAVEAFWLMDGGTGARVTQLADYDTIDLAFAPAQLSLDVDVNDATDSVVYEVDGAWFRTESGFPYTLGGDSGGNVNPVPGLRSPGWITISATPWSEDGGTGVAGETQVLHLYRRLPDFVVSSTADRHDAVPGDGTCRPAPLGFTAKVELDTHTLVPFEPTLSSSARVEPLRSDIRAQWLKLRGIDVAHRPPVVDGGGLTTVPGQRTGCSLRAAIEEANALPGAQTISVDGRVGTYALTKGELVITDDVNLYGYERPVVDAQQQSRVLRIDGGEGGDLLVNIDELDLANGQVSTFDRGGVVFVQGALLQLSDSVVRGGRANFGGGIYLQAGGDLTMSRSTVRDNVAGTPETFGGGGVTQRGGGIYNLEGNVTIRASAIVDNLAVRGGGLSNKGGLMEVENSSVLDNEAVSWGGGIENQGNGGETGLLHLSFTTVAGNAAGTSMADGAEWRRGGGLATGWPGTATPATTFVANSIVAENTLGGWPADDLNSPDCVTVGGGSSVSYRANVVGVLDPGCGLADYSWGTTAWIEHGTLDDPLDPGLTGRINAFRPYRNLLPGSVALDGGAGPGATLYPCPEVDVRDQPRPAGQGCDIGAVERQ